MRRILRDQEIGSTWWGMARDLAKRRGRANGRHLNGKTGKTLMQFVPG